MGLDPLSRRLSVLAVLLAVALGISACAGAPPVDTPRTVAVQACIDGLDNLHVKAGMLSWEHLAWSPPGVHHDCAGTLHVNGTRWDAWQNPFPLGMPTDGQAVTFEPVVCRGNCRLIQLPSAENGWEAIYQFDDFFMNGAAIYSLNITIGGDKDRPQPPSVRNTRPAPKPGQGGVQFNSPAI